MWRASATLFVLALAVGVGCSSASAPESGDQDVQSELGLFVASFQPEPNPPVVGENGLLISLTSASAEPVLGATVSVEPWMPAHGHGSAVVPQVSEIGAGEYRATQINYSMPGRWELRVVVTADGASDRLTVAYEVR